jgi:hypothetical protein
MDPVYVKFNGSDSFKGVSNKEFEARRTAKTIVYTTLVFLNSDKSTRTVILFSDKDILDFNDTECLSPIDQLAASYFLYVTSLTGAVYYKFGSYYCDSYSPEILLLAGPFSHK